MRLYLLLGLGVVGLSLACNGHTQSRPLPPLSDVIEFQDDEPAPSVGLVGDAVVVVVRILNHDSVRRNFVAEATLHRQDGSVLGSASRSVHLRAGDGQLVRIDVPDPSRDNAWSVEFMAR